MGWMFRLSLMNMKRRKARTVLTVLGVTIGVISIVSLLALGFGVKKELLSEFENENTVKTITVSGGASYKEKSKLLTDRTLEKFRDVERVSYVYPQYEIGATLEIGKYSAYTDIVGIPSEQLEQLTLSDHSSLENSGNKPGLILGNSMGLFFYNYKSGLSYSKGEGKGLDALVNTPVNVEFGYGDAAFSAKFKVTGVLAGDEEDYSLQSQSIYCDLDKLKKYLKRNSQNNSLYIQPTDANGNAYKEWIYTSAVVVVDDIQNVDFVVKKLQDMGYETSNAKEYLESAKKQIKMIQLLLGGIGTIALVVAIIGISNTMTTSVYDRINEIGMLKVIGCDTDELLGMFLFESGVLGFAGGLFGVGLSYGIKGIINKVAVALLDYEKGTVLAVIPPWLVFVAIITSTVLGILAGYIPARWASKLNPLEAIRK
ncbi:MAG: ABC transporter permease [Clostridium sp.]|nr:ABC transporter permease [Clostridium sp.]MCM1399803.1 ABC transporter permease [Clostridium sp.]MCM1459570.1 ABC transporter permease [Bacteroides sp.]